MAGKDSTNEKGKNSKNKNSELGAFVPVNLKDIEFVNRPKPASKPKKK